MKLLFPLGLLALIAIPLLIAIYIIKSKYTEQVIGSTYLWQLSEKFLKRRNPISRLTGIISLILQILAVVFISLAIAHPVFTLKGRAADYCFILDCSGSMTAVSDGVSRFDAGKEYISEAISSSMNGSTYTLIEAGAATGAVFKNTDDKEAALRQLEGLTCSQTENDLSAALAQAQGYFEVNPAYRIYLVTDKTVTVAQNIEVVTLSQAGANFGLSSAKYEIKEEGVSVKATLTAYGAGGTVTVQAFVDEQEEPSAEVQVTADKESSQEVELLLDGAEFAKLTLSIKEGDAIAADSGICLYNSRQDNAYKTLIVSDAPFFWQTALDVLGGVKRECVSTTEYDDSYSTGYGLYIYDCYTPTKLPSDGAVWFINPEGTVSNAGFSVNGREELAAGHTAEFNKSTAKKVRAFLSGCDQTESISLKSYMRCSLYRSFTTLMSCDGNPVLFVGSNAYGNREAVFAFDTAHSDISLSYNFTVLVSNLLTYTFPAILDQTLYYCGDTAEVNVLAGCSSIRVDLPDGSYEYLDASSEISECLLTQAGQYKITAVLGSDTRTVNLYSQLPESERATSPTLQSAIISGEGSGAKRDGRYEDILYIFIVLAVIVVADWTVYCYEQYQLR